MATRKVLRDRLRRKMRDLEQARWSDDELNDAINFAIGDAWPSWFELKQGTSSTVASNTFIYTLPTDARWVTQVWLEQSSSQGYIPLTNWRQSASTGSTGTIAYYLYLDNNNSYEAGKTIKVIYEAAPPELANDTNNTVVPTPFILAKAAMYLYEMEVNSGSALDTSIVKQQLQWNQQIAEDIRVRQSMNHTISHIHTDMGMTAVDMLALPGVVGKVRAI